MVAYNNEREIRLNVKVVTFPLFLLLIYVVFTFMPWIYSYLSIFGEIKILLLAGIALVTSYIWTAGNYKNSKAYQNRIFWCWLGYLTAMGLSGVVSYDRGLTLRIIETNVKYMIVSSVMIKIIDSDERIEFLLGVFAACGMGMALSTILNYFVMGRTFEESYRGMALESGIFGDPNDLAMLFNVTLPILLYFFTKKRKKVLCFMGLAVVITAIMLTYSRGGFLGLCTVGFGFSLLMRRGKASYVLLVLAAGVLFWGLAPEKYKQRISSIREEAQIDQETGKYRGRIEGWKTGITEGMKRPVLGVGAGCSYYMAGFSMRDWHAIHNSFIQVFSEMGILGLAPFVLLFFLPYKQFRGLRRLGQAGLETHLERFRFLLLSLVAFAGTSFFLPQAYSPIFYFLTGLILVQTELASRCKAI